MPNPDVFPPQNDDDKDRPWIADGSETSEHEDFLIGNRAGLKAFKVAIEQALATGEGKIAPPDIDYHGVRVVENDPRLRRKSPPTLGGKLFGLGCLLLMAFLLVVLFLGLRALPDLLR